MQLNYYSWNDMRKFSICRSLPLVLSVPQDDIQKFFTYIIINCESVCSIVLFSDWYFSIFATLVSITKPNDNSTFLLAHLLGTSLVTFWMCAGPPVMHIPKTTNNKKILIVLFTIKIIMWVKSIIYCTLKNRWNWGVPMKTPCIRQNTSFSKTTCLRNNNGNST